MLLAADGRLTDGVGFRIEILKTALRAYVATQQQQKAEAAMRDLEQSAGDGAALTRAYLSLGRQLEESLRRIRAEGREAEADEGGPGLPVLSQPHRQPPPAANHLQLVGLGGGDVHGSGGGPGLGPGPASRGGRGLLPPGGGGLWQAYRGLPRRRRLRPSARGGKRADPTGPLPAPLGPI